MALSLNLFFKIQVPLSLFLLKIKLWEVKLTKKFKKRCKNEPQGDSKIKNFVASKNYA